MSNEQDIDCVVDFLTVNVDFFAAPFIDGVKFQDWAKINKKDILPLSRDMTNLLLKSRHRLDRTSHFIDAICGSLIDASDAQDSLLNGRTDRIRKFLARNPDIVNMFKRHMKSSVINKWYHECGEDSQNINRIKRSHYVASMNYVKYLENDIRTEVCKINEGVKNDIINKYDSASDDTRVGIEVQLSSSPKLLLALQKRKVILEAANKLDKPSDKNLTQEQCNSNFLTHLEDHKAILTTRRDSGFETFCKALGVVGASIFGVGVGGYFAYKHLFGSRATKGGGFMSERVEVNKSKTLFR